MVNFRSSVSRVQAGTDWERDRDWLHLCNDHAQAAFCSRRNIYGDSLIADGLHAFALLTRLVRTWLSLVAEPAIVGNGCSLVVGWPKQFQDSNARICTHLLANGRVRKSRRTFRTFRLPAATRLITYRVSTAPLGNTKTSQLHSTLFSFFHPLPLFLPFFPLPSSSFFQTAFVLFPSRFLIIRPYYFLPLIPLPTRCTFSS